MTEEADSVKEAEDIIKHVLSESPEPDPGSMCSIVLEKDPPCRGEFGEVIRWRMCRAWDIIKKGEARRFGDAIRKAASEYRSRCEI